MCVYCTLLARITWSGSLLSTVVVLSFIRSVRSLCHCFAVVHHSSCVCVCVQRLEVQTLQVLFHEVLRG